MVYKIRERREELNMTQEELAAKSGVSRTTISSLENGTMRATTTKTLLAIAKTLNCKIEDIIFYADNV